MPAFCDVPIGGGFATLGKLFVKVDGRHAADVETNETRLFWDVAEVLPVDDEPTQLPETLKPQRGKGRK